MKAILMGLLLLAGVVQGAEPVQRVQQLVDYLGVDYRDAVAGGRIVNSSEYEEMQDFARILVTLGGKLPDAARKRDIQTRLQKLQTLVAERADPSQVATLASDLRQLLISGYGLAVAPAKAPDLQRGAVLFAQNCAGCHGALGGGDGLMAATLDPRPTDFTDVERYRERTLYGLYSTISNGLEGTAMQAWTKLSESDRWALAFYVGGLATGGLLQEQPPLENAQGITREILTTRTPAEMETERGEAGVQLMAWLRLHPESLWHGGKESALDYAVAKLEESRQAYLAEDAKQAHDLAVTAYLDGFELVESNLDAMNADLRHQIESGMTEYRRLIRDGASGQVVSAQVDGLQSMLQQAREQLGRSLLSAGAAFTSALVILLREGLEAILVIAALAAFLIKTGRRDGLRYLYYGTGGALLLGLLTWFISSQVVEIGGAGREMTEALAALFAAAMLFYVGFWLHSKTNAAQWKAFIQGNVQKALSRETLWGLAVLAFIAVYREIFESVLFYQALWLQTDSEGQGMIVAGLASASAGLILLAWLILRFSTRLPLRQFFSVTSIFMFVLAVVFAGKGVAALQEVGLLSSRHVNFPSIDLLGVYPNMEGLSVQLALVVIAIVLLLRNGRQRADV